MSGRLGQARKNQSNFLNTSKYITSGTDPVRKRGRLTSGFVHFGVPMAMLWG
jgi:hypothetical protein